MSVEFKDHTGIITDPNYFNANEAPYLSAEKTDIVIVKRRVEMPRAEYIYMRRFIIWRIAQHNEYREIWDFLSTVYPTKNTFAKIDEDIKILHAAAADLDRIRVRIEATNSIGNAERPCGTNLVSERDAERPCGTNLVSERDAERPPGTNLVSERDAERPCGTNLVSERDAERIKDTSLVSESTDAESRLHLLIEYRKIYEKLHDGRLMNLNPHCGLYRNWFGIPPREVFDKTVAMYDKKFCEKYAPIFKFDLRTITSDDPLYLQKDCDLPPIIKFSQRAHYYNTCLLSELESDLHLIFPRITPNYLYFELNPNITKEFILKHMDCECWRQWDLNILARNPAFRWRDLAFIFEHSTSLSETKLVPEERSASLSETKLVPGGRSASLSETKLVPGGRSASLSETKLVPGGRSVAETKSIMCTNYMANPNITVAELKEIITLGAADMLDTNVIYNFVNDNQLLRNTHVYRRELAAARKERTTAVTAALDMPGFGQILGRYIDYE
jgi:hypothetical protein